jgi:polysaccharide pyruvyl transferase WcaK-like protein
MSIGGDMYCYKEYYPSYMIAVDKMAKSAGKPLVLWGASIEKSLISDEIEKDLESFDLISVRESISYETLVGLGINKNLHLYPDPAFTMREEQVILPENWVSGNTVGINISPLIMRYEAHPGALMKAVIEFVQYILDNTDCAVALIPHVFIQQFNDMDPLREIHQQFSGTGRVALIGENHSAPQLKGFIAQCRFFIGARTHATIAAYSSRVPTLALGYSVKARGIARDIFGDEKGLVLPIQDLSSAGQLIGSFNELREREAELRSRLIDVMPEYVEQAGLAIEQVRNLFEILPR